MAAGSTYTPIATQTLGAPAASITFSSIPATYTDLRLVVVGNFAVASRGSIIFNSDTGTNYSRTNLVGNGTAASSTRSTSAAFIIFNRSDLAGLQFWQADVFSYAGSTNKTVLGVTSADQNGSGDTVLQVGLWRDTAAITSLTFKTYDGADFSIGATATLYGIKAA